MGKTGREKGRNQRGRKLKLIVESLLRAKQAKLRMKKCPGKVVQPLKSCVKGVKNGNTSERER